MVGVAFHNTTGFGKKDDAEGASLQTLVCVCVCLTRCL